ncbi:glycosyltransferase family protein [Sphingosinicella soli]|uniref:Spore maturation protein CgeB n=1 Tax=Sphingosinicella soli TaxID=333708 RepID=A0A7W7B014_9SPHN|nr:spore maturation protein CgeB [Sphingosinicella soli]
MKILLVIMRHDYGDPERGDSYEYRNFLPPLESLGHEVRLFDYMGEMRQSNRDAMNAKLLTAAQDFCPDLAIFSLYTDQILPETVEKLRAATKTFCFFHDDTWRIDFSRFWAARFDWFSSPDAEAKNKYRRIGLHNVIYFPFGVNEALHLPAAVGKDFDVSFVGGWHPYRQWLVDRLRRSGLKVEAAGYGWPAGVLSQTHMVDWFNRSRINLNLSNSSSWDARYLLSSPRALLNSLRSPKMGEQLKARAFEINACRAFQLSYYVDGLERCYRIGEEIAIYLDPDDLVRKLYYYLEDEGLRHAIAEAGYARTLAEHSYASRFARVFCEMGLEGREV